MASGRDLIFIMVLLFAFGVFFLSANFMFDQIKTSVIAVEQVNESSNAVEAFNAYDKLNSRMDMIFFVLMIGLILAMVVASFFVGSHPIFTFIYFITIIISVVASAVLANAWEQLADAAVLGTTVDNLPITNNVLTRFPIIMSVIGFLGVVVMFAKPVLGGAE